MKKAQKEEISLLFKEIRGGGTPGFERFERALGDQIPLLRKLEETPQDPRWHGEGSVRAHIEMVLEVLYRELQGESLSPRARLSLVLSTLLHDLGKPLTTREELRGDEVRIVSPGHASRGRSVLSQQLWEILDALDDVAQLNEIMELVGAHHDPLQIVREGGKRGRFRSLAGRVDLRLLTRLERADVQGRIAKDLDELVTELEIFEEEAKRRSLWGESPLASFEAKLVAAYQDYSGWRKRLLVGAGLRLYGLGSAETPEVALAKTWYLREGPMVLLTCGVSGAGKSTWVGAMEASWERIGLDEIRGSLTGDPCDQTRNREVLRYAKDRLRESLRRGAAVIWDATNLRRDFRKQLVAFARRYQALVGIVAFPAAPSLLYKRNQTRERPLADEVLETQLHRLQWPHRREADGLWQVEPSGSLTSLR